MATSSECEALLELIRRCEWPLEYYERFPLVAPRIHPSFHARAGAGTQRSRRLDEVAEILGERRDLYGV